MATIGVVSAEAEAGRQLALVAGESGHAVHAAPSLDEAVEILRERRPSLMLVLDSAKDETETLVRELLRAAPLMPVIVALKSRDANRAVALMRLGAAEVVAPPWTRANLAAVLAKTLRFQGTSFSVVHVAARPRHALYYFFAVLALFAAALGYVSHKREVRLKAEAAAKKSWWDLPYKHPAGMAFDGRDLWVLDWFSQSLYVHDPGSGGGLPVRRVVHFPADIPVAVSFAADAAWSASASGMIIRHMKDAGLTPVQKYKDAAPHTLGMVFDGLYLWTCDSRQKRIYKHLVDEKLSVIREYPYAGASPAALAFDGKSLWSLDSGARELLRHNLERPEEVTGRLALPEYGDGSYTPVGMAWDGARFWTVGERLPKASGPARLFVHQAGIP